ncbi:hypothetical protein [Enterococcus faecalis]|uniref:hypothetical protein n=1 Tax=Enterococcus faecalis TaxID=1351 RepID=UPI003D0E5253
MKKRLIGLHSMILIFLLWNTVVVPYYTVYGDQKESTVNITLLPEDNEFKNKDDTSKKHPDRSSTNDQQKRKEILPQTNENTSSTKWRILGFILIGLGYGGFVLKIKVHGGKKK